MKIKSTIVVALAALLLLGGFLVNALGAGFGGRNDLLRQRCRR